MLFFKKLLLKEKGNKNIKKIDKSKLPQHIAIIMDGNGRWAERRGMPRNVGHREGSNTLRRIVESCYKIGIKYLTVYAFSTENWNRPQNEVNALMNLLLEYLKNADKEIGGKNIRIRVIGSMGRLSPEIRKEIKRVTENTANNDGLNLVIALNYGGRDEIVNAARRIARDVLEGKFDIDEIDERKVADYMYTSGIPDPDLLIKPGGEKRISNFLLWQMAYTELWYSDVLWPDFREEHLVEAIIDYQNRNRRFGGV